MISLKCYSKNLINLEDFYTYLRLEKIEKLKFVFSYSYRLLGSDQIYYIIYIAFGASFFFYPQKEAPVETRQVYKKLSSELYRLKYSEGLIDWYTFLDSHSIPLKKISVQSLTQWLFDEKNFIKDLDTRFGLKHHLQKTAHYEKLKSDQKKKHVEKI